MTDSLAFLAGTKPTNYFHVARANAAKILALETQLGLTPGAPIFNLSRAKARIGDLQSMVAAAANKPAPTESDLRLSNEIARLTAERTAAPYAKVAEQPAPVAAAAPLRGRALFAASCRVEKSTPEIVNPQLTGRAKFAASFKTI